METPLGTPRRARGIARGLRRGYVLVYILLTMAVLAVVAAVVAPVLLSSADTDRIETSVAMLRNIVLGVDTFVTNVTVFPGNLSELSTQITTSQLNSCRRVFTSAQVTNWTRFGTFGRYYMPTTGMYIPMGRIRDSIPARPTTGQNPYYIEIPGVTVADARAIKSYVDGGAGDTISTLPAVVVRTDTTTVRYRVASAAQVPAGQC